nr:hypothetical protein [Bacillota bacterium]
MLRGGQAEHPRDAVAPGFSFGAVVGGIVLTEEGGIGVGRRSGRGFPGGWASVLPPACLKPLGHFCRDAGGRSAPGRCGAVGGPGRIALANPAEE